MSVRVTCKCGKHYRVKAEMAGKRVRCPACRAIIVVPPEDPCAQGDLEDTLERLLQESKQVPTLCPACGNPLAPDATKKCPHCGRKLRTNGESVLATSRGAGWALDKSKRGASGRGLTTFAKKLILLGTVAIAIGVCLLLYKVGVFDAPLASIRSVLGGNGHLDPGRNGLAERGQNRNERPDLAEFGGLAFSGKGYITTTSLPIIQGLRALMLLEDPPVAFHEPTNFERKTRKGEVFLVMRLSVSTEMFVPTASEYEQYGRQDSQRQPEGGEPLLSARRTVETRYNENRSGPRSRCRWYLAQRFVLMPPDGKEYRAELLRFQLGEKFAEACITELLDAHSRTGMKLAKSGFEPSPDFAEAWFTEFLDGDSRTDMTVAWRVPDSECEGPLQVRLDDYAPISIPNRPIHGGLERLE